MPAFNHYDLALLNPAFDSPLVDVLTELEHLRRLQLGGTTPPEVFFQLFLVPTRCVGTQYLRASGINTSGHKLGAARILVPTRRVGTRMRV